jgi:3-oxoisoapionate kinase
MEKLRLTFYGDDFTGSTDALEQLTLAGIHTVLFIEPPTRARLKDFPGLQAVGVAGNTRSLAPAAMARQLGPALGALKSLGARHVHYKVCSTFDSSPAIGNIGRVIELAAEIFPASFIPLLVAAPSLGRYTVFGQHFARYGIGSTGTIHRLDRHPAISHHPVTPMTEADIRLHLAKQTKRSVALFDILKLALPASEARAALRKIIAEEPDAILFDAITPQHMALIGNLLEDHASARRPLFSIGSSGIEAALAAAWPGSPASFPPVRPVKQILIGSGSCSPVTSAQIAWALDQGFAEVPLDSRALMEPRSAAAEIRRAVSTTAEFLAGRRSVIVHTTKAGADQDVTTHLKSRGAKVLGMALGEVLRGAIGRKSVSRICIAGGDTSSYAARALGIDALEMIAPLTPGAPLCRAHAGQSPVDGLEIVFKGGQVGPEDYFGIVRSGKHRPAPTS